MDKIETSRKVLIDSLRQIYEILGREFNSDLYEPAIDQYMALISQYNETVDHIGSIDEAIQGIKEGNKDVIGRAIVLRATLFKSLSAVSMHLIKLQAQLGISVKAIGDIMKLPKNKEEDKVESGYAFRT